MKKFLPPLAVLILAGLFLGWWFQPENVLKRRIASLFDTAEVPITMSELSRSSRGPNVAEYLSERIDVGAPDQVDSRLRDSYHHDDLAGIYSAVARRCSQISIEAPTFESIEIDGNTARVRLRVDIIVEFSDRRPVDGIQVMDMTWEKPENHWQLSSISWTETGR
ncbi:hypothetical protein ACFQY0_08495 [Haloferula chungangensis]|uniref:Nuclear transport factor 2 family protein n=1 Tax=Haloferula chungangensis TaxID=1048331 RepID=A0ABW2L4C9_9BACT